MGNRTSWRRLLRHLTGTLLILTLLASLLGTASAAPQTLTILGASGTAGSTDPYTEYSMDGGATWQPAHLYGWHPWGFVPGTNSWLNCAPSGEAPACLNRTVLYRIRFTIPAGSTNPQMTFDVKADNDAAISVNGTHVANISGQGGTTADASIAAAIHTGVNEIRLDVTDTGGWAGINYKITLNVDAPAPPVLGVPTIATSGSPVTVKAGATGVVDPGVTLLGFDTIDGATVTMNGGFVASEDRLTFTNQNGIVGTFNASTGVLTLSGSASSAAYEAALRTVAYSNTNRNSNQLGPRTITFSVGAGTLFNADTGHFYQYVASPGISWHAARDAAAGRSLYGLQGYLATITSAAENSFVTAKLAGRGWIGASDAAQEGVWRWVTGPEAGTHFSNQFKYTYNTCAAATAPGINGQYAHWGGGEPNDCGSYAPGNHAEDFAHFYTNGTWNDYPSSAGVDGYVVEYGGMAGDAQPVLSANATVNVIDGAPPVTTATQAPTQQNGSALVTLRATDNITVVPVTSYRIDGGPAQVGASPVVTGAGTHDLTYWSLDDAGNVETQQTVQIYVDPAMVAPTVTAQTSPTGFTGPKAQLSGTAEPGSMVAVYLDADPAYSNLALGKPVAQSSWYNQGAYPGTAAVDGLITGSFGAHTANGSAPWWQVDLGQSAALDRLVIWNRIDCCSTRENTLKVLISADNVNWTTVYTRGGAAFGGLDPNGSGQLVQGTTPQMAPAGGLVGPLKLYLNGARARYVRLQVLNPDLVALNFDELQVFGTTATPAATVLVDGTGHWSYTTPTLSQGAHGVRVVAYGAQGSAQSAPLLLQVDATAPVTSAALSGQMGDNGWYKGPVMVNLTATDSQSGVQATYYAVDGAAVQPGTNVTVTGDGPHTVGYYSVDQVGNGRQSFVVQGAAGFWQDTGIDVPAGATLFVSASGTVMWDYRRPESVTGPDGAPGFPYPGFVSGATFSSLVGRIGNGPGFEVGSTYAATVQTGGRLYLGVNDCNCFGDNSGSWTANIALGGSVSFKVDATAPTITGAPDRAANGAGWYNDDVTVTFTCTDALSGLASCSGPQTLGEGAGQSAMGTAVDNAGNTAGATVSGIHVDKVAPFTTISAPTTWQNQDVPVTLTASDNLSGVAATYYTVDDGAQQSGTSFTLSADGIHIITYWSVDAAGNAEAAQTAVVQVDQTAPMITGAPDRAANGAGWYNADVTVTFTCTDALSGVASCSGPQTLGEGAGQSATGTAEDNAGNTASAMASDINIDKTAPTITGAPDRAANSAGWYNADVTVTFTCTDALSGVASCSGPQTLGEGAGQSAMGTAVDNAGNTASATVSSIHVDQVAPFTTISAPTTWQNQDVPVTLTASDNLSGVAATYYTVDDGAQQSGTNFTLSADGIHIITYWSVDAAGNAEAAQTAVVQVDQTAPMITGAPDRAANGAGWYNADVTVTFTCTDALSGVASCSGPQTLGEGAGQSATGTAEDNAGNTASATVSDINVDKTAPTVTYAGNAGTYSVDQQVTISCTAADSLSGVASSTCAEVTGPAYAFALGVNSFSATAVDNAGNVTTTTVSFTVSVTNVSLCSLTKQFVSNKGIANSLCVKLDNAAKQASAGKTGAANNMLQAFVSEVAAQAGKALTVEQAAILTRLAKALTY